MDGFAGEKVKSFWLALHGIERTEPFVKLTGGSSARKGSGSRGPSTGFSGGLLLFGGARKLCMQGGRNLLCHNANTVRPINKGLFDCQSRNSRN